MAPSTSREGPLLAHVVDRDNTAPAREQEDTGPPRVKRSVSVGPEKRFATEKPMYDNG
jgi:hypothetical protein